MVFMVPNMWFHPLVFTCFYHGFVWVLNMSYSSFFLKSSHPLPLYTIAGDIQTYEDGHRCLP